MLTTDELHAADKEHAVAIAELRMRIDGHDEALERHERHMVKLDETVTVLRETIGRVATKEDISDLRKDIGEKFDKQLSDAHNSVPIKLTLITSGAMFLLALIGLVVDLMRHHA